MSIKEHDGRTDSDTHFQQGGHPSRNQSRTPSAVCSAVSYYFLLDNRKPLSQILYVCCLFRRDYAKHRQKRKEKKQAKEEHKIRGQHGTEQIANCTNETGGNRSDEDYHRQRKPEKGIA
jgi:hypothetical protein|nr:hypothetical protein [Collinsella aerofaciens]